MENLREIFEEGLRKKGITAKELVNAVKISEAGYYRALRTNKIRNSTYKVITDYLQIDTQQTIKNTAENKSNAVDDGISLYNMLLKRVEELTIENWTLKRELGKFNSTLVALSA